jgi:hypothetical protein
MTELFEGNPVDAELTALNAQLDALAADIQAALVLASTSPAPPVAVGEPTGMERVLQYLAKAGQVVEEKLGVTEKGRVLERYARAHQHNQVTEGRYTLLVELAERARRLHREIAAEAERLKVERMRASGAMEKQRRQAQEQGIPSGWIDLIGN